MELTDSHNGTRSFLPKIWEGVKTPWFFAALLLAIVLVADGARFGSVAVFAASALAGTAPYIVLAILLIAGLKATGAETMVAEAFKGNQVRMVVMAAFFGGLAPFCSCEVIPFIAALLALGAPVSAIMAFWLSSPLIDPPTLLITAAALGWPFAVGKAVAAVALGLMGGFATMALMRVRAFGGVYSDPLRPNRPQSSCCSAPDLDGKPVWSFWKEAERRRHFGEEFLINGLFLLKWLTLAYVLEALMVHYLPAQVIANLVGGEGLAPIVIAALVGMPAYLNSYVAPPMLAGLIEQGMSDGAAMAFMVSGAVSSLPAMMAVWSLVRGQIFTSYLVFGLAGAVIAGGVFQALL